jgi:hypothetical protein
MADGADAFVSRLRAGGMQMATAGGGGGGVLGPGGGINVEVLTDAAKAAKEAFHDARSTAHGENGSLSEADATQHAAKSAAGNALINATKKYKFDVIERPAIDKAIRDAAGPAAEKAYQAARAAGEKPAQANTAANKAAKLTAEAVAKDQARRAATQTAERAIKHERAFEMGNLGPEAQNQLSSFKAGTAAERAKQLPAELAKLSEQEFLAKMASEPCTAKTVNISGPPPQVMHVYEYADGTVVRYKPLGDQYRNEPTYSVEVKKDAKIPDQDRETTAFKVDPMGRPLPKGPYELKNPYPEGSFQADVFEREVMNAGHRTLRK